MTTEKNKKTLSGVVVSDKMTDTVVVRVDRYIKHPKYQKFMKKSKKYSVHNPGNTKQIDDKVEITEIKPISKTKRFAIVD
ncbi:MAG TPA: 30S ribosomal protein S17 [Candidatus Pacebacteria bacterium]|nr:30S ribosomal protein S17 [Candidatus Paceibacterota bacterium]HIP34006.1 30S ribosomal protein S17 [Bacteroidia bacterium]